MTMRYRFSDLGEPDPDGHRYVFSLDASILEELDDGRAIEAWCYDAFGPEGRRWTSAAAFRFWFRDEIDATHFKLRWC